MNVCTSTSGRGLNECTCAKEPLDVVLQQEECLIEHLKLSIKDECHCPKGFWGKMQCTFSPYREGPSEIPGQAIQQQPSLCTDDSESKF